MDSTIIYCPEKTVAQQMSNELIRATKLDAIIGALYMLPLDKVDIGNKCADQFRQDMTKLSYIEFNQLPRGSKETVLGINNLPTSQQQFSYTEKKSLRNACLEVASRNIIQPVLDFICTTSNESNYNVFEIDTIEKQIIEMENKRKSLQKKLIDVTANRVKLLQQAAELRTSPQLTNELETVMLRLVLCGEKTSLLRQMVEREITFRTDHAQKALKQIEGFVDSALETYKK